MSNEPVVHIVDDNAAVRASLVELVEADGLRAEAHPSAERFLQGYDADRGGCLVLDIRMPGMSGLALQEELARRSITLPIIIITGHATVQIARRGFKMGAIDFVEKPFDPQEMLTLIRGALARDAQERSQANAAREVTARIARLSAREAQVMQLIVRGRLNKQIAAQLGIAERTVEDHRRRVMQTMEVESLAHLVRLITNLPSAS